MIRFRGTNTKSGSRSGSEMEQELELKTTSRSGSTRKFNLNKMLCAVIAFGACLCIHNYSITSTHTSSNNGIEILSTSTTIDSSIINAKQNSSSSSSSSSSSAKRLAAPQSQAHPAADPTPASTATTSTTTSTEWYEKPEPLLSDWPKLSRRLDAIPLLEKMKLKRGIEVGVQKGILAKKTLGTWKSCEEYKLVDLWGKEDGYQEPGEHTAHEHNVYLRQTRGRVKPWTEKGVTEFFVMRSTDAAKQLKNDYFDFIYLDARHDYCAVKEDIEHYYPKLRPGGILSGHDYTDAQYAVSSGTVH